MRELPSDVCGRSSSFCQSWLYKGWKGWPVLARCWCGDSPLCWDDCSWFRGQCATLLRPCDVGDRSMEWAVKMLQHACRVKRIIWITWPHLYDMRLPCLRLISVYFSENIPVELQNLDGYFASDDFKMPPRWFRISSEMSLGLGGGHSSTSHLGFLVRWCDALKW